MKNTNTGFIKRGTNCVVTVISVAKTAWGWCFVLSSSGNFGWVKMWDQDIIEIIRT